MGEAGAMLVLEELEHAQARGATIHAELLGYGVSSDANHVSDPDPTGENPARAMRMALDDAGVDPSEVGYVNAHGTSTPSGDAGETRILKVALGEEKAYATPVSSTKGATGHCLGAAGAVEAIFTILALDRGMLPPTINYEVPDPECDLDYIPNEARPADIDIAVSNSFGFGGHNACVVFKRWRCVGLLARAACSRVGSASGIAETLRQRQSSWQNTPAWSGSRLDALQAGVLLPAALQLSRWLRSLSGTGDAPAASRGRALRQPQLEQHGVVPDAVALRDPLAPADLAEAARGGAARGSARSPR